jgi:hypothetical protein
MKIIHGIAIGALGICCAAVAQQNQQQQQQSPFQPPVVAQTTTTATIGSPLLLNLTGVTVTDQTGQPVGPIQHLLLSPSGCVDLAVLPLGGQKLVPIPWMLVSGTGAARGETEIAGRTTLALKVDRTMLQQAPSVTVAQITQLNQPQMIQQVHAFFGQQTRQNAAGGTSSQTGVNVGGATQTNQAGIGTGSQTNLSPTGATNARPGQPGFSTNRPGTTARPPFNRPPTNRPPATTPGQPAQPAQPGQPGQPIQ